MRMFRLSEAWEAGSRGIRRNRPNQPIRDDRQRDIRRSEIQAAPRLRRCLHSPEKTPVVAIPDEPALAQ